MKFVFFIVSTMLIVLISQHSTMGLPVTDDTPSMTVTERTIVAKKDPERRFGACPEGMVHGEHGICKESELTEATTTALKDMEVTEQPIVLKKNPERRDGACPEGMVHGEHGICKESGLLETTTVRKVNLNDCPTGTKKDEQGSCQEIVPTNTKNVPTDPKIFLEKGGFCPASFKMVNGRCLYIKPKFTPTLYPVLSNGIKSKSGNAESIEYEKVRINADGSCPEGTEYSEYGFCQKRISPSKSKFDIKADEKCPADFELINGKCTPKNSKEQDPSSEALTTSASPLPSEALATSASPLPSESTTVAAEPKVDGKSKIETAAVKESSAELVSTTPEPL